MLVISQCGATLGLSPTAPSGDTIASVQSASGSSDSNLTDGAVTVWFGLETSNATNLWCERQQTLWLAMGSEGGFFWGGTKGRQLTVEALRMLPLCTTLSSPYVTTRLIYGVHGFCRVGRDKRVRASGTQSHTQSITPPCLRQGVGFSAKRHTAKRVARGLTHRGAKHVAVYPKMLRLKQKGVCQGWSARRWVGTYEHRTNEHGGMGGAGDPRHMHEPLPSRVGPPENRPTQHWSAT